MEHKSSFSMAPRIILNEAVFCPIFPIFPFPKIGNRHRELNIVEIMVQKHCEACCPHTFGALWSKSSTCSARYRDCQFSENRKIGGIGQKTASFRPSFTTPPFIPHKQDDRIRTIISTRTLRRNVFDIIVNTWLVPASLVITALYCPSTYCENSSCTNATRK